MVRQGSCRPGRSELDPTIRGARGGADKGRGDLFFSVEIPPQPRLTHLYIYISVDPVACVHMYPCRCVCVSVGWSNTITNTRTSTGAGSRPRSTSRDMIFPVHTATRNVGVGVGVRSAQRPAPRAAVWARRCYSADNVHSKADNDYLLLQAIRGDAAARAPDRDDLLNSPATLPRYDLLKTVGQIRRELLAGRPGPSPARAYDGLVVQYRRARNVFRFFKEGLLNVWRVHRALRRGLFSGRRYVVDYSGAGGGRVAVQRGDFGRVVDELSGRVALLKIEYDAGRRTAAGFLGWPRPELLLSRREFVEMVRDRANFVKLPLFGALFVVLEELSLPLIFLFPQMLPGTCVLPGALERRYYARSARAFGRLVAQHSRSESECRDFVQAVAMGRVSAAHHELADARTRRDVCHVLHCRGTTAAALQQHQKILLADDYLVVAGGGVGRLSDAEVVHGCVVRGLAAGQAVGGAAVGAGGADADAVAGLRQQLGRWLDVRFVQRAT